MTPLIEKHIDTKKIKDIAKEKNLDPETYNEFIRFMNFTLEQDEKYGHDDEDHEKSTLDYVCEYIDNIIDEREKGFSFEWAKEYVIKVRNEEEEDAPAYAYVVSKSGDPEQATKDLELYGQLTDRDELFLKHFVYLLCIDVACPRPSVIEQAANYSIIFQEQISNGKSELFANKYAELTAMDENTEISCYAEAIEFEKAINAGFSENYAKCLSDSMAEYIANEFSNYEDSIDDELVEMERDRLEKALAHLK